MIELIVMTSMYHQYVYKRKSTCPLPYVLLTRNKLDDLKLKIVNNKIKNSKTVLDRRKY